MKNANAIAREIKNAYARYMAAKAEADRLDDMLGAAIDAGEDTAEIELEWETLVDAEVEALDRTVAALACVGIDDFTARRMVTCPAYADRFSNLCARLAA